MTTAFTLSGWKTTTATALITRLPLQTFETVLPYIDGYLSSVGGWIPDDSQNPTGPGFPANGFTPTQAADAIAVQQMARVHRLSAQLPITISVEFMANLATGQTEADIIAQMQPLIRDFLERQFNNEPIALVSIGTITGTVTSGGELTPAYRQTVNTQIQAGSIKQDPIRVAVNAARVLYNLDNTWNAVSAYTEPDQELVVVIKKYLNTTYDSLDSTAVTQYVFSVSFADYRVISGTAIPINP